MTTEPVEQPDASVTVEQGEGGECHLTFTGRLDLRTTAGVWREATRLIGARKPERLVVDVGGVTYCDGTGMALLLDLKLRGRACGYPVEVCSLRPKFQHLLDAFDEATMAERRRPHVTHGSVFEDVGRAAAGMAGDLRERLAFLGELCAKLCSAAVHPWRIRWKDALLVAEHGGANAVGIIVIIGFLFGLILAFSSAMPMQQFGVEVYVVDLVALALARVLGPVMTAIILAGRTGSAFAAELGTMKINSEIDALTTMGLDPVRFLVVPRVLAAAFVAPLLGVLTCLAGLVGVAVVIRSLGYPMVVFRDHVISSISGIDLALGAFKTMVFGGLVGGVSCLRGLQTGTGASAVGTAATRAVVSSIIIIIFAEGAFSVLTFFLGI